MYLYSEAFNQFFFILSYNFFSIFFCENINKIANDIKAKKISTQVVSFFCNSFSCLCIIFCQQENRKEISLMYGHLSNYTEQLPNQTKILKS